MSAFSPQETRSKYSPVLRIYAVLLSLSLGTILLVREASLRIALSDWISAVVGLVSSAILFTTAWRLRAANQKLATAWLFLALGCFSGTLGAIVWAVLVHILHQQPFPSAADFLFPFLYIFGAVGLSLMPHGNVSASERTKNRIDLSIVFLAATMIYWNFLVGPLVMAKQANWLEVLIATAYPIFDLLLFAVVMTFLYRKPAMISLPALVLIAISNFLLIIADTFFCLQSIAGTFVSGTGMDFLFHLGIAIFGVSGIAQLRAGSPVEKPEPTDGTPALRKYLDTFLTFSPYVWLVAAYALLLYAQNKTMLMNSRWIITIIGIMMALILVRQIMAIAETRRLSKQLQTELVERQHVQELLRRSNEDLEGRVVQRTVDLTKANLWLNNEIGERRQAEAQLEQSLHEKEILLKEIHHRVKNNLQIISSMLALQVSRSQDEALANILTDSQNRIQSMALIHDKLYQSADLARIDFAQYLESLAAYLSRSFQSTHKAVNLSIQAEPVTMEITQAVPCGLIVNELVTNAFKHAYPGEAGGVIFVKVQQTDEKQVQVIIHDDGVGMPGGFNLNTSTTLGLQMVHALVEQIDGTLHYQNQQGSTFTITIPIAPHG